MYLVKKLYLFYIMLSNQIHTPKWKYHEIEIILVLYVPYC